MYLQNKNNIFFKLFSLKIEVKPVTEASTFSYKTFFNFFLQNLKTKVLLIENSLVAWKVKNLPAIQETWIRFLVWEDNLEKGMATHSSIIAWRIPQTEGLAGYSPGGQKELDVAELLTLSHS